MYVNESRLLNISVDEYASWGNFRRFAYRFVYFDQYWLFIYLFMRYEWWEILILEGKFKKAAIGLTNSSRLQAMQCFATLQTLRTTAESVKNVNTCDYRTPITKAVTHPSKSSLRINRVTLHIACTCFEAMPPYPAWIIDVCRARRRSVHAAAMGYEIGILANFVLFP